MCDKAHYHWQSGMDIINTITPTNMGIHDRSRSREH
jgi:hypothetical protein